jgi:hypothetical protein
VKISGPLGPDGPYEVQEAPRRRARFDEVQNQMTDACVEEPLGARSLCTSPRGQGVEDDIVGGCRGTALTWVAALTVVDDKSQPLTGELEGVLASEPTPATR